MLVEFTAKKSGKKISINADAVAYVVPDDPGTGCIICISGKEGDEIWIDMQYRLAVEQLQDAMS